MLNKLFQKWISIAGVWQIRLLALILSSRFTLLVLDHFSYMFHGQYSLLYWKYAAWYFMMGNGLHSGLWLASTKLGKEWPYLTLLLLIPTILIAPIEMPQWGWFVWAPLVTIANIMVAIAILKKGKEST